MTAAVRTGTMVVTLVATLIPVASATAAARPVFRIVAIGDSYASGEGAPALPGDHTNDGRPIDGKVEVWDNTVAGDLGKGRLMIDVVARDRFGARQVERELSVINGG